MPVDLVYHLLDLGVDLVVSRVVIVDIDVGVAEFVEPLEGELEFGEGGLADLIVQDEDDGVSLVLDEVVVFLLASSLDEGPSEILIGPGVEDRVAEVREVGESGADAVTLLSEELRAGDEHLVEGAGFQAGEDTLHLVSGLLIVHLLLDDMNGVGDEPVYVLALHE